MRIAVKYGLNRCHIDMIFFLYCNLVYALKNCHWFSSITIILLFFTSNETSFSDFEQTRVVERSNLAALEFLMSKQPRGNVRVGASHTAGARVSNIFVDVERFQTRFQETMQKATKYSQVSEFLDSLLGVKSDYENLTLILVCLKAID